MKLLVNLEDCSDSQRVPPDVAAADVCSMPIAIVAGQLVQPRPHSLRGDVDLHSVTEENHDRLPKDVSGSASINMEGDLMVRQICP